MFGNKKEKDGNEPVFLLTVNSSYQLGLVENILRSHDIPCLAQDRATGGYMRIYAGGSIFGTDIYVSPENQEKAKELLSVLDLNDPGQVPEDELAKEALEAAEPDDK